jgi:hypothetical protein
MNVGFRYSTDIGAVEILVSADENEVCEMCTRL